MDEKNGEHAFPWKNGNLMIALERKWTRKPFSIQYKESNGVGIHGNRSRYPRGLYEFIH